MERIEAGSGYSSRGAARSIRRRSSRVSHAWRGVRASAARVGASGFVRTGAWRWSYTRVVHRRQAVSAREDRRRGFRMTKLTTDAGGMWRAALGTDPTSRRGLRRPLRGLVAAWGALRRPRTASRKADEQHDRNGHHHDDRNHDEHQPLRRGPGSAAGRRGGQSHVVTVAPVPRAAIDPSLRLGVQRHGSLGDLAVRHSSLPILQSPTACKCTSGVGGTDLVTQRTS